MQRVVIALLLACDGLFAGSLPPLICASGGAVAAIDLRVVSPSPLNANPLPFRTINRIEEGDVIRYKPLLRPREERKGDVTLVLVPADKKAAGKDLLIFDPRPAAKPAQWKAPWRVSLAAFVYGPSGLNVKKVEAFLDKDDELVGELADYAEKTAKAEALIAALSSPDNSRQTVNAALAGFSSQFGFSAQVSKTDPTNQQAMTMFRALNPSVAAYDPLAGQGAQPVGQTAGLATMVAEMFFGSPVGLAAGGTAMLLNLGALAFPRSEFRSAFSQAMPDDGVGLCGKAGAAAVHTRVAYLWAVRVPDSGPPRMSVGKANSLPVGVKSPLPLSASESDWKYLDRARNWVLQPDTGKAIPVKVQVLANTKSIELDLAKSVKPGRYSLKANWDWDQFDIKDFFEARPLADFASARPTPATQDRLMANTGKVLLTLQNADFEFVTKVEIKKLNDEFAAATPVPFVLPKGLREGVQDHLDVQVATDGVDAGKYDLLVSQVDGKPRNIALNVLPQLPSIENLPIRVNQDVSPVEFTLKGARLGLLQRLEIPRASVTLGTGSLDGTERNVTIRLDPGIAVGDALNARVFVADRAEPVTLTSALRVLGPRPALTDLTVSQLPAQSVQLGNGELPGGAVLAAMIHVAHFPDDGALRLQCEPPGSSAAIVLHPGQKAGTPRLQQLTPDQLFLTFDTGAWFNGCVLDATVTGSAGDSSPRRVARIVDTPTIEQFDLSYDGTGDYNATLVGSNLQTIGKAGWAADQETEVSQLPQPLSNDGHRQKLQIHITAPPAPDAVLYLSLRGDPQGRPTTLRAN
jgi:hypothetical protein